MASETTQNASIICNFCGGTKHLFTGYQTAMCTLQLVTAVNFTYHISAELQPTAVITGTSSISFNKLPYSSTTLKSKGYVQVSMYNNHTITQNQAVHNAHDNSSNAP